MNRCSSTGRSFEREFDGVLKFEPVSRLHDGLVDILQVGCNDAAGYFYYVMEICDDVSTGQIIVPEQYCPAPWRTITASAGACPSVNASGWVRPLPRLWVTCTGTA